MEKKISDILHSIDNGEYKIPEFQRGYVWNSKQVKGFFRSFIPWISIRIILNLENQRPF